KKLATTFWDVIKNEKTTDFKYIFFSTDNSNALPKSEQETFDVLLKESKKPNAISYAVYNDNNLIGFFQLRYWENNTTLEISEIWFIKSARGKGFSVETNKTIEEIAFSNPNISRIGWQCFEQNIQSKNAALHNGYKILKTINDSIKKDAVRLVLIKTPPVRQ
ncbi:MAG: GNAT family N-acetyltransferase, partial [Alphaproteobacteria bacterium]